MAKIINKLSKFRALWIALSFGVFGAILLSVIANEEWRKIVRNMSDVQLPASYTSAPKFLGELHLEDENDIPYAINYDGENYLVSYLRSGKVNILDDHFRVIKTLDLSLNKQSSLTGITGDGESIWIADIHQGELREYDYSGNLSRRFDQLPEPEGAFRPYGLAQFNDVLYVSERKQRRIMAISLKNVEGLTAIGEVLFSLSLNNIDTSPNTTPTHLMNTPDGRIIASWQSPASIMAYSCNGRVIGSFNKNADWVLNTPGGLDIDDLPSPKREGERAVFDPSEISRQGRIHVVEQNSNRIFAYSSTGDALFNWGDELIEPVDICINKNQDVIVITDQGSNSLKIYGYKG